MRSIMIAIAAGTALAAATLAYAASKPKDVSAALSSKLRPAADVELDAGRHAAAILSLTDLKAGGKAADVFPGGGYYTRIFATMVGPKGKVYAVVPQEAAEKPYKPLEPMKALAAQAGYGHVVPFVQPMKAFDPPEKLDLVFISQFYHDMHNASYGGPDIAPVNKAVFNALKPGGVYLVIDHSAPDGSGLRDTNTTHRIDVEAIKTEVVAAGFVLEQTSEVLRNPDDPRTANVFTPAVRGKTDQFVLKFRKPK